MEHKPGIKTTEFWVAILATIVVGAGAHFGLDLDPVTVAGVATTVITYIIGRIFNKKKESDVEIALIEASKEKK